MLRLLRQVRLQFTIEALICVIFLFTDVKDAIFLFAKKLSFVTVIALFQLWPDVIDFLIFVAFESVLFSATLQLFDRLREVIECDVNSCTMQSLIVLDLFDDHGLIELT